MDFNSLLTKVYDEREGFMMYNMATSHPSADPYNGYSAWHSKYDVPGRDNTSQLHNKKNDELLDAGKAEFDIGKAKKIYEEWAVNMNEEVSIMIIYANLYTDLVNNRVKEYEPTSLFDWADAIYEMELKE